MSGIGLAFVNVINSPQTKWECVKVNLQNLVKQIQSGEGLIWSKGNTNSGVNTNSLRN